MRINHITENTPAPNPYGELNYRNVTGTPYTGAVATTGKRYDDALQNQQADPKKLVKELQNNFIAAVKALSNDPQKLDTFLRLMKAVVNADIRTVLAQATQQPAQSDPLSQPF